MASQSFIDGLRPFQDEILGDVYGQEFMPCPEMVDGAVAELKHSPEDVVRVGLGDLGSRLKAFSEVVDFSHPHLDMCSAELTKPKLSQRIHEFLETAKFVSDQNMKLVIKELPRMVIRGVSKEVKALDDPRLTGQYVRLLASAEHREAARLRKESRAHDFYYMYRKKVEAWETTPSDFEIYHRGNNNKFQQELQKAEDKKQRYRDLGLVSFGAAIDDSIHEFKDQFSAPYFGFHKLTVTQAGLILAKLHKCTYEARGGSSMRRIWWEKMEYVPRIHPLHTMENVPKSIKKLVDFLEEYPPANRKSIFDHYLVIVPSVTKAPEMVDALGIEKGEICPILLGEADGKCYFIAYYMQDN